MEEIDSHSVQRRLKAMLRDDWILVLEKKRIEKNMTQKDIAAHAKVQRSAISQVFTNTFVSVTMLKRICEVLDVPFERLLK